MTDLTNLYTAKGLGHHFMHKAREKGEDSRKAMAFVGLVTMAIGAIMLLNASKQFERGRGR